MLRNPFERVSWFEDEVAEYTGAPFAVAVDSCTNALFLCLEYINVEGQTITIPTRTYLSVPQSIMQAGAKVAFQNTPWSGAYQLAPTQIYDSAKRFTSNMYKSGTFMCLSFHHKKPLPIGKGGMILTDNAAAVIELRKMRYEGRTAGMSIHEDILTSMGWNMYMTPEEAARGLTLLSNYPSNAPDMQEDPPYPDLSKHPLFVSETILPTPQGIYNDKSCVVIQGPLEEKAYHAIKSGWSEYPVIFSTWGNQNLDFVSPDDEIIITPKPPVRGTNNINLQKISTLEGLNRAKKLGYKRALKWRSDLSTVTPDILMSLFKKDKINLYAYVNAEGGYITDFFMEGEIDDLITLWSFENIKPDFPEQALTEQLYKTGLKDKVYFVYDDMFGKINIYWHKRNRFFFNRNGIRNPNENTYFTKLLK